MAGEFNFFQGVQLFLVISTIPVNNYSFDVFLYILPYYVAFLYNNELCFKAHIITILGKQKHYIANKRL